MFLWAELTRITDDAFWNDSEKIFLEEKNKRLTRRLREEEETEERVRCAFIDAFDGCNVISSEVLLLTPYEERVYFAFREKSLMAVWLSSRSVYSDTGAMMGWEIRNGKRVSSFWGQEDIQTGKVIYSKGDLYGACLEVTK